MPYEWGAAVDLPTFRSSLSSGGYGRVIPGGFACLKHFQAEERSDEKACRRDQPEG
jgi:hypothetical protein